MLHTQTISDLNYLPSLLRPKATVSTSTSLQRPLRRKRPLRTSALRHSPTGDADTRDSSPSVLRRQFLLVPSLAFAASCLLSTAKAEETTSPAPAPAPSTPASDVDISKEKNKEKEVEPEVLSRVYDATVIGEPQAVGKDRNRVWEKLMAARVVYLGEAEMVPDQDDRVLELEIVKNLSSRCAELERPVSLALEAFPRDLQEPLNQFMDGRIDGKGLKSYTSHWPEQRWQEYEPLLNYCRENKIKLVACGTPLQVLRTVQAEGIHGLSKAYRKIYTPPAGSGFISGFTSISGRSLIDRISSPNREIPFGPTAYLSAQARVVDDYTISQTVLQAIMDGEPTGMLIVITGASHVIYGSRGIGVPARISRKIQKKSQVVVLLDPERQDIRREGEIPLADFLWYSAAKPCNRNCFDRAEIARVMNAAGRRREGLPQDIQKGLDLGVVSPEILQNFFDLEKYPVISELTHRFQGFRERLLADPKFLNRLAIEEAISITTTLLAQYERRKGRFWEEIDYVLTDTIRGIVVDFFTVWLPAPTISFLSHANDSSPSENLELLKGFIGSFPDNAFQKNAVGTDWNLTQRVAAVLVGGTKLASVGVISSIGAGVASDVLYGLRRFLNPSLATKDVRRRTPILKSAAVYGSFLGTSANLRYQVIAGLVEHRFSEYLISYYNQPFLANVLSFVARTINSYWGTQQWVDLARYTGIQRSKDEPSSVQVSASPDRPLLECTATEVQMNSVQDSSEMPVIECSITDVQSVEDSNNQSDGSHNLQKQHRRREV